MVALLTMSVTKKSAVNSWKIVVTKFIHVDIDAKDTVVRKSAYHAWMLTVLRKLLKKRKLMMKISFLKDSVRTISVLFAGWVSLALSHASSLHVDMYSISTVSNLSLRRDGHHSESHLLSWTAHHVSRRWSLMIANHLLQLWTRSNSSSRGFKRWLLRGPVLKD